MKRLLVVLDFDGLLVDAYALIRATFATFELDVGDEGRFRNRRKFLKYLGGGKELVGNLARFAVPKKPRLRAALTETYLARGRVHRPLVPFINACIADPGVHVGILSRNFTLHPGATIRHVLAASGVHEADLDFVIPLPAGIKKTAVLEGMNAARYRRRLLAGDEVGDYRAACATGYTALVGSYGFDAASRLLAHGVPPTALHESPVALASALWRQAAAYLESPSQCATRAAAGVFQPPAARVLASAAAAIPAPISAPIS